MWLIRMTAQLIATQRLKGATQKLVELTVENCHGSLEAEVGGEVTAFKIHGEWWLSRRVASSNNIQGDA